MTQDEIIEMARQAGIIAIHTEGDGHWHQQFIALEAFAKLVEQRKCQELADKIEKMPFGDTAASFAVWIREQA